MLGVSLLGVESCGDKKNMTENKINLGSNDFVLKNKNRTIKPYVGGANFDEEIKKDQIIEGTMTFEISKNKKKVTLIYRPHEKDLVTWNIEI